MVENAIENGEIGAFSPDRVERAAEEVLAVFDPAGVPDGSQWDSLCDAVRTLRIEVENRKRIRTDLHDPLFRDEGKTI